MHLYTLEMNKVENLAKSFERIISLPEQSKHDSIKKLKALFKNKTSNNSGVNQLFKSIRKSNNM